MFIACEYTLRELVFKGIKFRYLIVLFVCILDIEIKNIEQNISILQDEHSKYIRNILMN